MLLLVRSRKSNFKPCFSHFIGDPFEPGFPFSCLLLATSHQTLHNDQLASGRFGPRCEVAGGAFPSQAGSVSFSTAAPLRRDEGDSRAFRKASGVLGCFQTPTAFILGSVIVASPHPPSIYIPGTDSEAIEIGFGIAECEQAADGTLPEEAGQLGEGAECPRSGGSGPSSHTHTSPSKARWNKMFCSIL